MTDPTERIRIYTRSVEFDYVTWTLDALLLKGVQGAMGIGRYLTVQSEHSLVLEYLNLVEQQGRLNDQVVRIYSDPSVNNPEQASALQRAELAKVTQRMNLLAPFAESILQSQVSAVAASMGLTLGGQPFPPVEYHTSPLPLDLIISPRNVIRQDQSLSLLPDLTLEQMIHIEDGVAKTLDVSTLVVPVGGIGVYPTMVMQTTSLDWLSEVISHEWTHNFLTLRPLGINYDTSPELRTMNETTANISGNEIGLEVLKRYYPEKVPPPPVPSTSNSQPAPQTTAKPEFDYQKEMHATRVTADALLAAGKIKEAEAYMEARRQVFWDHGYHIRKLNQAYFAFYGAYADQPGGAAGEDPVGPAVRALRVHSASLADFLNRISWMTSFAQLKAAVR